MTQSIGLLGGTFNPIHYGHLILAEEARIQHHLDLVLFIPNFIPPHRNESRDLASPEFRYLMTVLATVSNPHFSVSDIELKRKGPSYTVDTVIELKNDNPKNRYFLISGADSFSLHQWHEFGKLVETLDGLLIADRSTEGSRTVEEKIKKENPKFAGKVSTIKMNPVAISATEIRERIRKKLGIRYQVPESVEQFIERNLLYR